MSAGWPNDCVRAWGLSRGGVCSRRQQLGHPSAYSTNTCNNRKEISHDQNSCHPAYSTSGNLNSCDCQTWMEWKYVIKGVFVECYI